MVLTNKLVVLRGKGGDLLRLIHGLRVLCAHLFLSLLKQYLALEVGGETHIARVSELEVVVEALLANPVSFSLHWLLALHVKIFFLHLLALEWLHGVLNLDLFVTGVLGLLAPVAALASFEVVVLAAIAQPASFREVEARLLSWLGLGGCNFSLRFCVVSGEVVR